MRKVVIFHLSLCYFLYWSSSAYSEVIIERSILESFEQARTPDFSEPIIEFLRGLPPVEEILNKSDLVITDEVLVARRRIEELLQAPVGGIEKNAESLLDAVGIVLLISPSTLKVKGALSSVCIDQNEGLFLTAVHPFNTSELSDVAIVLGRDGSVAGIQRVLLRDTSSDIILFTTRAAYKGQVESVGESPQTGDSLSVYGSCPGAAFIHLSGSTSRASIHNWETFGRSRAKWFDLDRGFPSGLSGGAVCNSSGQLLGLVVKNITSTSHGSEGSKLELGRAIEIAPLLRNMR